jgi:hypothetical protein
MSNRGGDFMSISDQLHQWQESKAIVELHYIDSRLKKVIHGRIYSFDSNEQKILFYDDDAKKIENINLAQIEDMIAGPTTPSKQVSPEAVHNPTTLAAVIEQTDTLEKKETPSLKKEIIGIIELLPSNDLYAVLPLLRHLSKNVEK